MHRAFIGLEQLPRQHLPKAYKSKSIGHRILGKGIAVRTNNRKPEKPGKEEIGKGNTWEDKGF